MFNGSITKATATIILYSLLFQTAWAADLVHGSYPLSPDLSLTPGELCSEPVEMRYPERIPYCERNVGTREKWAVISRYTTKLKFIINSENRSLYKIDHFIPLCMGGANTITNLWPQHEELYRQTDSIEELLCEKMAQGVLSQSHAIELIKKVKLNRLNIPVVLGEVSLLKQIHE